VTAVAAALQEAITDNSHSKATGEYYGLARAASSPYLREYFQRNAELYRARAQGERRVLEREGVSIAVA
jgi:hypothetical protein